MTEYIINVYFVQNIYSLDYVQWDSVSVALPVYHFLFTPPGCTGAVVRDGVDPLTHDMSYTSL